MFELGYGCDGAAKVGCDGVMIHTGEVLQMQPPRFKHRCPKCGDVKYLNGTYPVTMGLPINTPIPEAWYEKLLRSQVKDPPPEKSKIEIAPK